MGDVRLSIRKMNVGGMEKTEMEMEMESGRNWELKEKLAGNKEHPLGAVYI